MRWGTGTTSPRDSMVATLNLDDVRSYNALFKLRRDDDDASMRHDATSTLYLPRQSGYQKLRGSFETPGAENPLPFSKLERASANRNLVTRPGLGTASRSRSLILITM